VAAAGYAVVHDDTLSVLCVIRAKGRAIWRTP
jgi:hypothetical protein